MATKVLKELAVAVSSYEDRNSGQTKNRYENIGALMEFTNDRGEANTFLVIKRTFNPAGVMFKPGSDKIMISMFDPKPREGQQSGGAGYGGGQRDSAGSHAGASATGSAAGRQPYDDEIPF